jgi:DNA-binding response OmpR family regulator
MRDSWRQEDAPGPDWVTSQARDSFEGASVLIVEDDKDIRDLLVTLLGMAGYAVTACSSAEGALQALREEPFDFVLTDYSLPGKTGGWLLEQAESEGLLNATGALVVTAHPSIEIDGFDVLQKPFDLDDLVVRVQRGLSAGESRPSPRGGSGVRRSNSGRPGDDGRGDCPGTVELILYVSAESPRSANAIQNIKNVLSRYRSDKVSLTICDLSANPSMGDRDSITFTPTLVKRSPGPRTFILGHITNPAVLIELLEGCDMEA